MHTGSAEIDWLETQVTNLNFLSSNCLMELHEAVGSFPRGLAELRAALGSDAIPK